MIDPAIQTLVSIAFSLLFLIGGAHKLSNRLQFQQIVSEYKVLPSSGVGFFAIGIGLTELFLGVGWLFNHLTLVPLLSALVLSIYVIAISINLYKGRSYIDCGCSFAAFAGNKDNGNQRLSTGLVLRNFTLIIVALMAVFPSTTRDLGLLDYFSIFIGLISILFIYLATNQLLSNRNAIDSWRKVSG